MVGALAVALVIVGAGLVGLGQRAAGSGESAPGVLGVGVVWFLGGVALASFRSGDRVPVFVVAAILLLTLGMVAAALRRR